MQYCSYLTVSSCRVPSRYRQALYYQYQRQPMYRPDWMENLRWQGFWTAIRSPRSGSIISKISLSWHVPESRERLSQEREINFGKGAACPKFFGLITRIGRYRVVCSDVKKFPSHESNWYQWLASFSRSIPQNFDTSLPVREALEGVVMNMSPGYACSHLCICVLGRLIRSLDWRLNWSREIPAADQTISLWYSARSSSASKIK